MTNDLILIYQYTIASYSTIVEKSEFPCILVENFIAGVGFLKVKFHT